MKNHTRVRRLVLLFLPLLFGLSVVAGTGPGPGLAEAIAVYAWWLPAAVFTRARWHRRHERLSFAYWAWAFATLAFALLAGVPLHAVTRWPTGLCALLAAVIALGASAALWPAQRRFYAMQQWLDAARPQG